LGRLVPIVFAGLWIAACGAGSSTPVGPSGTPASSSSTSADPAGTPTTPAGPPSTPAGPPSTPTSPPVNGSVVNVVPDYAGSYDGTMFISECVNDAVPTYCRGFSKTGRFLARLTQAKDAVSGTLSLFGSAPSPIEGRIDTAGRLTVTGRLGDPAHGVFIDLESWSTFLDAAGAHMYGTFTIREMNGAVHLGSKRADLPGIDRIQ
jgi:hypothetical protein